MGIFKLVGDIFVNNEKANDSLDKTDSKALKVGKSFQSGIKTVGKFGAVLGGAALAGGAAMIALGKKTGDAADRLLDLSSITGMSTDELQKWEKVSTVAGVSSDAISNVSQKLTKQMDILATGTGKAAEAADTLGLSYESLGEMNADERMNALVTALQGVEDPTERARLGTDLLGGSWKDLAPILDVGAERLADVKANANIISNDDLNQANEFRIKMDQMKEKALEFGQGLAVKFIPILNKLFDWFSENAPTIESVFTGVMDAVILAIDFAVPIIGDLITAFMLIKDWVVDNMPAIKQGFEDAFNFIMEGVAIFVELFQTIWNEFGEEIMAGLEFFWEFFKQSFEIGFKIIKGIFDFWIAIFKGDWKAAWEKFKEIIALVWEQIQASLKLALDILKSVIDIGLTAIETVVSNIFNGIKDFISGIWDGIVNGVKESINFIIDLINGMINKINKIDIDIPFSDEEIGFNVPTIPRLQVGGTITSAGRVMVGEAGPEELLLPAGASVIPLNKQGMSGGIQVIVQGNTLLGDDDEMADKLGTVVVDRLRELGVVTA